MGKSRGKGGATAAGSDATLVPVTADPAAHNVPSVEEPIGLASVSYWSKMVDVDRLTAATGEGPFDEAAYDVLTELVQSVAVVACLKRQAGGKPRPMTRNEAILAGLMVRCLKLQRGMIEMSEPDRQRLELGLFFQRGITEAAVNLRYLLERGSDEVFDAFVRDSLKPDRKLHDKIQAAIAARGETLAIEARMLRSIARNFERAGVEMESVDPDDRGAWSPRGIYGRFEELGIKDSYLAFFQIASHYVHGSWNDLITYQLEEDDQGNLEPSPEFAPVRPQPILAACEVLADASAAYLRAVAPECDERDVLDERLAACHRNARLIGAIHEKFLGLTFGARVRTVNPDT